MNTTQKTSAAASLSQQRQGERQRTFALAHERHDMFTKKSGALSLGRDENGAARQTRSIESFPIILDRWYVGMGFKREDCDKLPASWKDVEAALKSGNEPRKTTTVYTHIIAAVRMLKHIGEGYQDEIEKTEQVLSRLDALNAELAGINSGRVLCSLGPITDELAAIDAGDLVKKQVAVKRIVARERLSRVVEMLRKAETLQPGPRDMEISRACAVLVSLRNRLGQWRDRQVAGIVEWNRQKEYALRVERDKWVLAKLKKFAESPKDIWEYEAFDRVKLETLVEAEKMIREKKPKAMILSFLKARSPLFRVSERDRKNAEDKIALMERGIRPKDYWKVDFLIGHYGWLYRFVNREDTARALAKITYLGMFVSANKPGFIARELSYDPDPYLAPILKHLETARIAYNEYALETAKEHFAAARDELKKFAKPEKVS